MELIESLSGKIKGKKVRIVFPEGSEPRILGAVVRLASEDLIQPILIGNPEVIKEAAKNRGFNVENIEIVDPANYDKLDEMVASFVERRKGKVTEEKAIQLLKDENYFGTMLTYMGLVDGLVSGAIHSTDRKSVV